MQDQLKEIQNQLSWILKNQQGMEEGMEQLNNSVHSLAAQVESMRQKVEEISFDGSTVDEEGGFAEDLQALLGEEEGEEDSEKEEGDESEPGLDDSFSDDSDLEAYL